MTEKQFAEIRRGQARRLAGWTARCGKLVAAKVADAEAHARRAITETLRAAPDGRPTARVAARNPSFRAAGARLDELRAALAGPSRFSLDGLLRDARADSYREAFELWAPHLDPDTHRTDAGPTARGEAIARGMLLHGFDLHQELEGPFAQARRGLAAAVNVAGRRDADRRLGPDLLGAWRTQTTTAIVRRCDSALADSQTALFWSVWGSLERPA